jgi:hypothetical protein
MTSRRQHAWLLAAVLGLGLGATGLTAAVQAAEPEVVVSPLVAMPIAPPNPVLGADDKVHLAYELVLINMAPGEIDLKKVETLDAASDAVLGTLESDGLAKMLKANAGGKGTTLPGGGSGLLFLDVTLAKGAAVPKAIRHRISLEATAAESGDGGDHDPTPKPPQTVVFTGSPLTVGPAAVLVAPPLKGSRWVAEAAAAHRRATIAARRCPSMARYTSPSASPSTSSSSTTTTGSIPVLRTNYRATPISATRSMPSRTERSSARKTTYPSRCRASCRRMPPFTWQRVIMSWSISAMAGLPSTPTCGREACG